MDTQAILPQNTEELIVWRSIRATYLFYVLGALYIVAPVIAWYLLFLLFYRFLSNRQMYPAYPEARIPLAIWLWIAGMLMMLIALIVGHFDYSLGIAKTIKSSIGWAKGWALLAIFPLIGLLNIRPQIIYRASMHVCLHTLILLPLFIGAWLVGLPQTLYVSPLQIIGGPGPEFFSFSLYEIDPGSGNPRWRLFTPWAPALGFVANIFFIFAMQEQERKWKLIGISASILMILMSGSRLALVALVVVWFGTLILSSIRKPAAPFFVAASSVILGLIAVPALTTASSFWQAFRAARVDSTRVRETLGRIAVDRWSNEAPIWGHGIVERGPHLVEFMPIGSHHSWYGLLFVKGIVGALALAIPLFYSLAQFIWWSDRLPIARVALAMVFLLFLYTFGENLEILAYLIWPALIIIGAAHLQIHQHIDKQALSFKQTLKTGD